MPPRTGPRRKRRKASPPAPLRYFVVVFDDGTNDVVIANRLEIADSNLVLHDANDAIFRIVARGEWREIRPATLTDLPLPPEPEPADDEDSEEMSREQATLANQADPMIPPEEDRRFAPSSPEEAQRILMEQNRRQGNPDHAAPAASTPPRPKE